MSLERGVVQVENDLFCIVLYFFLFMSSIYIVILPFGEVL